MGRYTLSNKALDDLSDIWNYTADEWSENQADSYYQLLISGCQTAANNLDIGADYGFLSSGVKRLIVVKHLLFYKKTDPIGVHIIRILHERMDVINQLE